MTSHNNTKNKVAFTDRQLEVMEAWAQWTSMAELAAHLKISENTVHTHLKRLRAKLKVQRTLDVYLHLLRHEYIKQ